MEVSGLFVVHDWAIGCADGSSYCYNVCFLFDSLGTPTASAPCSLLMVHLQLWRGCACTVVAVWMNAGVFFVLFFLDFLCLIRAGFLGCLVIVVGSLNCSFNMYIITLHLYCCFTYYCCIIFPYVVLTVSNTNMKCRKPFNQETSMYSIKHELVKFRISFIDLSSVNTQVSALWDYISHQPSECHQCSCAIKDDNMLF